MTILATIAGIVLIVVIIEDIFTVLFRPGAESRLSRAIVRIVWATLVKMPSRIHALELAGPVALASVICAWATGLLLGWTLIYLPHYPRDFTVGSGPSGAFIGALHVSLSTLTTLGSSAAVPRASWLAVVSPIEALIGFGLLTAAVAYLLQLYPVLSRRRSLAYEIHLLVETQARLDAGAHGKASGVTAELYAELTSRLVAVERDLVKFPIAYYFAERDRRFALAAAMPELANLAERGAVPTNPLSIRLRASMLQQAIDDFAQTVAQRFLLSQHRSTIEALRAFANDHRHSKHAREPERSEADSTGQERGEAESSPGSG